MSLPNGQPPENEQQLNQNGGGGGGSSGEGQMNSAPTTEQLNMRCTGVKRLLKEALEMRQPNELFCARPMEDNLFEWHFTVRGPPDTVYAEGIYHGRIVLPAEYPMKPPNLILLTPNGRFETNKKICLSISGYHPETWLPSWSIRTALLALIGFMPTHSAGALGGLECSQEERRRLALKSLDWCCPQCGVKMRDALPPLGSIGNTEGILAEMETQKVATSGTNQEAATQLMAPPSSASAVSSPIEASSHVAPPLRASSSSSVLHNAPSSSSSSDRLLENPLFWIFVLSAVFLALLLRRFLLNFAPVSSTGDGSNFQ